jgi:dolichyl-phosphate-mannose-protein mannosyltransferase
LFLCWALHYFPFWLMGRQRFLHHYLPAHLASTLVAAALVEFIFTLDPILPAKSDYKLENGRPTLGRFRTAKERLGSQSLYAQWAVTMVVLSGVIYSFIFFAPLTYGTGLDVEGVNARKWLAYDLHFAK